MPDKAPNTNYVVNPTLKTSSATDAGKMFDKNLTATNARNGVDLTESDEIMNEIDQRLDEKQGTFKKKIWDLSKMEALVHSDPKLETVYQGMETEAEENQRYGYHWNEAVLNIMFNDYVLNSPKYLQKYKLAIPKEKKRRDKSGIKQQQRAGEVEMQKKGVDTTDLTVNKSPTNVPENYDYNNSLEGVMEQQKELMENWAGDMSDEPNRQPVDQSNQRDYLDHRLKRKYDTMNEHHLQSREEKEAFIYKNKPSLVLGQVKSLSDEALDKVYNDIETEMGMIDEPTPKQEPKFGAVDAVGEIGIDAPVDESVNESGEMLDAIRIKDKEEDNDIDESTSAGGSAGSAGGASRASGYQYAGPFSESKNKGINTSFWEGGEKVKESNYLTNPLMFEHIYNKLTEDILNGQGDSRVAVSEKVKTNEGTMPLSYAQIYKENRNSGMNPDEAADVVIDGMVKGDRSNLDDDTINNYKELIIGAWEQHVSEGLGGGGGINERTVGEGEDIEQENLKILNSYRPEQLPDVIEDYLELHGISASQLLGKVTNLISKDTNPEKYNELIRVIKLFGGLDEGIISSEGPSISDTMKDVSAPSMGGSSMDSGGMFEGKEIDEDVASRIRCKSDEEPAKGVPINKPGGCKKKKSLEASPEEKKRSPHNIESRKKRVQTQSKEMEKKKKEQSNILNTSKKDLAEQKAMFEEILGEDKKPASMVNVDRLGKENKKNFVKDKKDSTLSDIVDTQDELSAMAQIEDVGENPYDLGEKIEAQKIKDNKMQSLDNEGDSTNDDNKHIPKRNLTSDEDEQVSLMRNGMHSLVYDNEPSERFEERMERDMGEEIYALRQKQMEFKSNAPMYNKDAQPTEDTEVDTDQYNKYKKGYITQFGESVVTGKYKDEFNKNKFVNFKLNEAEKLEVVDESFTLLNMDGLGNRYSTKVEVVEGIEMIIKAAKYYIKEGKIFVNVPKKENINETNKIEKKVVNEGLDKMKKLWGYDPSKFTETKHARNLIK